MLPRYKTTTAIFHELKKILIKKFKSRVWSLHHLKRNGFSQPDLVRVYKSMIRPVAEYCSSVYHTMITKSDSEELEQVPMQALKRIYGWQLSYRNLLEKSGIDRLDTRRKESFLKIAEKMAGSSRFSTWFPLRLHRRELAPRNAEKYKIYLASTERYRKSPLNTMRQALNEINSVNII